MICYMCVYCYHVIITFCYHVIITFCYKVGKIQEKNCKLSVFPNFFFFDGMFFQTFDWLSKHIVYNFMYERVWLCASIINTKLMSLV